MAEADAERARAVAADAEDSSLRMRQLVAEAELQQGYAAQAARVAIASIEEKVTARAAIPAREAQGLAS